MLLSVGWIFLTVPMQVIVFVRILNDRNHGSSLEHN